MWAVSLGVAGILIAAYAYCCGWKIFKYAKEIERVINAQDLVADVKESNLLKPLWTAFEKTLTTVGDKTYSTIDAAEFFNPQSLTRGLNMTFWQSYGGIFTGLGILGTFMGLTAGLSGVDMTSGDIEALKSGIAKLLSGVESAFVTSLVGIGCAILYSVFHHLLMKNFQGNVQTLADKLDEKFPRRSVEDWLSDINGTTANHFAEAQEQTTVLKNIGEQVTQAIHNALDEKLAEYVESICAAIDNLGAGGESKIGEIFSERVGDKMDRFSAALDKFSDKAETIMANAQEVSQIMNERLLDTLEKLDDSLEKHAESSAAERDAANQKFLETLESLTNTLDEVAAKIKLQQEDSVKNFGELLKSSLDNFNATMTQILERAQNKSDGMNQKFLETLESLTDTLNEVAEKIKAQQEDSVKNFGELLKASLDNFNAVIAQILSKVQTDTANATKQNQAANQEFLDTLAELSKTLQAVVDKFSEQQTGTLEDFELLVNRLIDDLDKIANANAAQISEAVKAFSDIVNRHNAATKDMFDKVQKLLNETETYLKLIYNANTAFKQAAEPVKQSTLQLAKNLTETSAQMNNLAAANRSTRENLSDLTARLRDFVTNFNGIANELDRSTKIISDSLGHYNYEMSKGLIDALTKFDASMGQALNDFNGLVDDFGNMVGDFKKNRR